ncbi:MAG TPA: helix-turn-helix domain-containing protein [Falsiroseomonas sp.]|nr:helix-turn-helix domain-containing protein [Falsiroseomonas sp.]
MARRARIVLAAAAGLEIKAICGEVGADANTVSKWRRRFATHRLDGLLDEPRPGTPRRDRRDDPPDPGNHTAPGSATAPPDAGRSGWPHAPAAARCAARGARR